MNFVPENNLHCEGAHEQVRARYLYLPKVQTVQVNNIKTEMMKR